MEDWRQDLPAIVEEANAHSRGSDTFAHLRIFLLETLLRNMQIEHFLLFGREG